MRPTKVILIPLTYLLFAFCAGNTPLSIFSKFPIISSSSLPSPSPFPSIAEICDNGIDDDADGFIDLFDSDCPCDLDAYQAYCEIDCEQLPDSFPDIELRLKWQSEIICNEDHYYPNIVCGDINGDNVVDVVTKKYITNGNNITNGILVFSGATGAKLAEYNSIPRNVDEENLFITIGDIDRDGQAEFFYSRHDTIVCVRPDGTLRWKSDRLNEDGGYCVNLADFNGDGVPEVYKGSDIVNAQTGRLLISGNSGGGCNQYTADCSISHTIAADLLSSAGLELAAGNTVYEVVITNLNGQAGNSMTAHNATGTVRDGMTSVGDIDGDQQLDVVVIRSNRYADNGGIWVWNPRTGNIIARANAGGVGGMAFIGNVAGDCNPEIGVNFENVLRMYTYNGTTNLQLLYGLTTSDYSGYTGVTMFDFNQDGRNELVYRDETLIRVMEGNTGATLDAYTIRNGTGMEYPVVADVDGDNEAEILVSGYVTSTSQQRIFCFESDGAAWAPARSVWNQPGYHVTNINDDLTIPRQEQNQAKHLIGYENCLLTTCPAPYNAFMAQATFRTQEGCVQFPAIDLALKLLGATCEGDSVSICYAVSNFGDQAVVQKNIGIAVWPSTPLQFSFPAFAKISLLVDLPIDATDTFCVKLSSLNIPDSIFMAVNDPGNISTPYTFPLTDLSECRYLNNIDSMDLKVHTIQVMADTLLCEGQTMLFHGNLITQSGDYKFTGKDCDSLYNLRVDYTPLDTVSFAQMICFGDSVFFDGNWLSTSGIYETTASNSRGCDSTTYLHLVVASQILIFDTLSVCDGESVMINGQLQSTEGEYVVVVPGIICDTAFHIWLEVFPVYDYHVIYDACPGDSFWIDNHWVTTPEVVIEHLQSIHGCDSILTSDIAMPSPTSPPTVVYDCDQQLIIASSDNGADWFSLWSNGQTTETTTFTTTGIGELTLYGGLACEVHYEFDLPLIPDLTPVLLWHDTSVLENHSILIDLGLDPDEWSVQWSPAEIFSCADCISTKATPLTNTTVTVFLQHITGCTFTHSFLILIEPIVDLYIPNVFSPNGDGINDQWIVTSPGERLEILKIDIFDRWGDHINEWTDLHTVSWDGKFREKPLNPAVFAYSILYLSQEQKQIVKQGNITLLR